MKEKLSLMILGVFVRVVNLWEFLKVVQRYYPNKMFRKIDWHLRARYFWKSPFQVSKEYLTARGETDVYTYGETPLTTLAAIAKMLGLSSCDTLYDLGSSTGRTSFWFHCFTQAKVVGFEIIPKFVNSAENLRKHLNLQNIQFIEKDIRQIDFSCATKVYLYGTCFDDSFLDELSKAFESLPIGAKVISVSYPLKGSFIICDRKELAFTWGKAEVFLNYKE